MKFTKYPILAFVAAAAAFTACNDDDPIPGNPVMDVRTDLSAAYFGDSLEFVINASDADVPLSTIRAELFYGDEKVSETVIRTKVSGQDYTGTIHCPYYANVPDGHAVLHLTLQNIHFTTSEKEYEVYITHADYPYLTFISDDADNPGTYRMDRKDRYVYEFTDRLPQKIKGHIVAPAMSENGREITFGYESNKIKVNGEGSIPFSNSKAGKYTVSFNTFTMEGSPFVVLSLNGQEFEPIDDTTGKLDLDLTQGQTLTPSGFPNLGDWWIDPDYFTFNDDETFTFKPLSGRYRVIADQKRMYFRVYALNGNDPATLSSDGSGALWVIGDNVGKPSVSANLVGWTTENALCMAQVSPKVYEITLVAGKQVDTNACNFKFFGQMGWGVELKGSANFAEINSDLVGVGDGNGHDDGNLYLLPGASLVANNIYKFRVDLTGGINAAKFTVTHEGEQEFTEKRVYMGETKMETTDNTVYRLACAMTKGKVFGFRGIDNLGEYYLDPDYFSYDEDTDEVTFLPVDGNYRITLNAGNLTLSALRLNSDGSEATFEGDGHSIWLMGWGVGSPSMDSQFGWTHGAAYCVAEVAPNVYQFSGTAGPEHGSDTGARFRTDYLSFKFFYQDGWGGEFSGSNALTLTEQAKTLLKDGGNFELAAGVQLENGATYVMTINTNERTLDFVKK